MDTYYTKNRATLNNHKWTIQLQNKGIIFVTIICNLFYTYIKQTVNEMLTFHTTNNYFIKSRVPNSRIQVTGGIIIFRLKKLYIWEYSNLIIYHKSHDVVTIYILTTMSIVISAHN